MISSEIQQKMLDLRVQYVSQLPNKVQTLQLQWIEICTAEGRLEVCPAFQRQIHNLRGTAGTYGCPEIGDIASEIETLLIQHGRASHQLDVTEQTKITAILHDLAEVTKSHQLRGAQVSHTSFSDHEIEPAQPGSDHLVYIVDDDVEFCRVTSERLNAYARCRSLYSKREFIDAISQRLPDVIIMDMMLPEGDLAGADAAMALPSKLNIPVVFVSTRGDEESRLAAIRAGASGYFVKQDDHSKMMNLLEHLITRTPAHPYSVLLIDDDVELSKYYQLKIESAGMNAKVLHTGAGAIAVIEAFKPEMILLDISMPDINGLELGALIRQYPAYDHIPIIYLTASTGEEIQLAAMRLGGDDFLHKPIQADYLTKLLLARLARVRVTRQGEYRLQEAILELSYLQQGLNQHSIVSIADLDGRITYVNEKFVETTGYTKEEVLGQNHRILKSGIHTPAFYEEMWKQLTLGKMWHGEITNRTKGGELYTVLSTIIPILNSDGLPQRYLSVRTDITQIKQLNMELESERERLSLALNATNTGIWEWNLGTNETIYDKNWCQLLGYTDGVHYSWPVLIHPDDHNEAFSKLSAMISKEQPNYQSEHRKQNAKGGWEWVLESGKVVATDETGFPYRIMGTIQIISERKKIEFKSIALQEQLNQAVKMEAVGHLTAGIAHDFNNILGAMLGYVELSQGLLKIDQDSHNEKFERYLGMIMSSGTRAKELIAQMLTFSRLSPEGMTGQVPVILLSPVLKEVVSLLRSSIPHTTELNYSIEENDIRARIKPVHLHQIILNLGINARDALSEFGKIEFGLSVQHCAGTTCSSCNNSFKGDFARISVHDNGKGIPEQILKKIFDPFFTTKEIGKGTGMGLSVVHGLVHALGGHIQVETSSDNGTTIHILLPQETRSETAAAEMLKDLPLILIKRAKILVVDDEQAMATMLQEFLSVYGAQVISYTDPKLALAYFTQQPEDIDLVVTDETMPGMKGLQLAEAMLQIKPGLPVILCTGYSDYATPAAAEKAGLAGFLNKPIKMAELLQKIEIQLQKKK